MPRISRGTPGSIATQRPRSSSSQMPGRRAVVVAQLARALGQHRLLAVRRGHRALEQRAPSAPPSRRGAPRRAPCRARTAPRSSGFVRSSLVGPRPPVVITAPVRSSASRTAAAIASAVSPTVVRRAISTPSAASVAREVRGVGVDRVAEQELVTDRDDFDVHGADGVGGPRPRAQLRPRTGAPVNTRP